MGAKTASEQDDVFGEELESEPEITGTSDEQYNLVSVLYHALQGAQTAATYIEDAEEVDDQELVAFFEEVQDENRKLAERAKELLAKRVGADALTRERAA